jgi:hypothetical protein
MAPAAAASLAGAIKVALSGRGYVVQSGVPEGRIDLLVALAHVSAGIELPESNGIRFVDDVTALVGPIFEGLRQGIGWMRDSGGAIVTLLIGEANRPPNDLLFEASAGAIANLTRSAALHAGKSGYRIRVNFVRTGSSDLSAIAASADAIGWLGDENADFVTGTEIDLDRMAIHAN